MPYNCNLLGSDNSQGWYSVKTYGAVGNGTSDDTSAIQAAIDATGSGGAWPGSKGAVVYFPPGTYRITSPILVDRSVHIIGTHGSGWYGPSIVWADECHGFIFSINGENGADGTSSWSVMRDIVVWGAGKGASRPASGKATGKNGIVIESQICLERVYVTGFTSHGISHVASSGTKGNANLVSTYNVVVDLCGITGSTVAHGYYVDGTDVNQSSHFKLDCRNNTGWGIYDSSYLGNDYYGPHTANNVLGGFKTEGAVNSSVFYHPYTEGDQPASEIMSPSQVYGADICNLADSATCYRSRGPYTSTEASADTHASDWAASTTYSHGDRVASTDGTKLMLAMASFTSGGTEPTWPATGYTVTDNGGTWVVLGEGRTVVDLGQLDAQTILKAAFDDDSGNALELRFSPESDSYPRRITERLSASSSRTARTITTSTCQYPPPGNSTFPNGIYVGSTAGSENRVAFSAAQPSSGLWRVGDVAFDSTGATNGWNCTATGGWGSTWASSTYYNVGDAAIPTTPNGKVYVVKEILGPPAYRGQSYTSEPTWPTSIGQTVVDNYVLWECWGVSPATWSAR